MSRDRSGVGNEVLVEARQDLPNCLIEIGLQRANPHIRRNWRLVSRIDASKVLDQTCPSLAVEPLGITPLAFRQWGIDKHLDEEMLANYLPGQRAIGTEWRNKGSNYNQTGIDEQPPELGYTSNVLHPVGITETQITTQSHPHVISIEQIGMPATFDQRQLKGTCNSGLPSATQTCEPDGDRLLPFHTRSGGGVHRAGLKHNIRIQIEHLRCRYICLQIDGYTGRRQWRQSLSNLTGHLTASRAKTACSNISRRSIPGSYPRLA